MNKTERLYKMFEETGAMPPARLEAMKKLIVQMPEIGAQAQAYTREIETSERFMNLHPVAKMFAMRGLGAKAILEYALETVRGNSIVEETDHNAVPIKLSDLPDAVAMSMALFVQQLESQVTRQYEAWMKSIAAAVADGTLHPIKDENKNKNKNENKDK